MVQPWINANFKSFRVILVAEAARNARCGMWPLRVAGAHHGIGRHGKGSFQEHCSRIRNRKHSYCLKIEYCRYFWYQKKNRARKVVYGHGRLQQKIKNKEFGKVLIQQTVLLGCIFDPSSSVVSTWRGYREGFDESCVFLALEARMATESVRHNISVTQSTKVILI